MKAYQLERYGKGQRLTLTNLPDPVPAAGEALVEIHATAINQLDDKIRDGAFKPILPYKPPFILGHDLAGIVVATGPGAHRFKIGDAVYARPRDGHIGTFAERIAVAEADLAPKPASLSMAEAASVPLVGLTAWQVLVETAGLKAGQKVLIHAGTGGVGTIAIQLAKHLGAMVATTASAANADLVRSLGADVVIDYRTQDFSELLSGYDVVLNSLDAKTLEKSLKVLKPGGKLISISGPPDPAFAKAQGLNPVLGFLFRLLSAGIGRKARRASVDYSFLFMHADGDQLAQLGALIDAGTIRPVLDRGFTFDALNDAVAYVDSGRAKGKVVVTVRPDAA
ncbi:NADP-dependent oxidoreductase [Sphingomonas sp. Leaf4]|uniref:NADP-dependent oxidoreductase n=1 Tax=Sphingomonas sp. Leaf4 TaxID=2876553 RepID=UPI001E2D8AAC|nr:NADP-dependent oxidoreductase [Sphingomonas sp. Leaf4]